MTVIITWTRVAVVWDFHWTTTVKNITVSWNLKIIITVIVILKRPIKLQLITFTELFRICWNCDWTVTIIRKSSNTDILGRKLTLIDCLRVQRSLVNASRSTRKSQRDWFVCMVTDSETVFANMKKWDVTETVALKEQMSYYGLKKF